MLPPVSQLTSAWCDWYGALPPEIGRELASTLLKLFPGGLLITPIVGANPSAGLVERLMWLAPDPTADAGVALTLAALTDFIFLERGDPSSWDKGQAMLDLLEHALDAVPQFKEDVDGWVEASRLGYPLRSRQWTRAMEGWDALRSGPLSPDALRSALTEAMVGAMAPTRSP